MQWGRLQVDVNCALRRGAWYRIARLASLEAILDVNHRPLKVPHYLVQVVSRPPTRWSVVPRAPDSSGTRRTADPIRPAARRVPELSGARGAARPPAPPRVHS